MQCGQLRVTTEGDPGSISMCHCLACQRWTGSAFGLQARWPNDRVEVSGRYTEYVRVSDAGAERTFRFCPDCGATVFWTNEDYLPDSIAVAVGAFADPSFPQPTILLWGGDGIRGWRLRPGSRKSTTRHSFVRPLARRASAAASSGSFANAHGVRRDPCTVDTPHSI